MNKNYFLKFKIFKKIISILIFLPLISAEIILHSSEKKTFNGSYFPLLANGKSWHETLFLPSYREKNWYESLFSYQKRTLKKGSQKEVLENILSDKEFIKEFEEGFGKDSAKKLLTDKKFINEFTERLNKEKEALQDKKLREFIYEDELASLKKDYDYQIKLREEFLSYISNKYDESFEWVSVMHFALGRLYLLKDNFYKTEFHYKETLRILNKDEFIKKYQTKRLIQVNEALATLYLRKGVLNKAEVLFKNSLELKNKYLSKDELSIAYTLSRLGEVYHQQNFLLQAEKYYVKSLEIFLKNKISVDGVLANLLVNIGDIYFDSRYRKVNEEEYLDKAESLYERALKIDKQLYGDLDLRTANTKEHLGRVYIKKKQFKKAEKILDQVLSTRIALLGENGREVAVTRNNLALIYEEQGLYKKAEDNYIYALKSHTDNFGKYHPFTLNSSMNLWGFYIERGELKKSNPVLKNAINTNILILQKETPFLAIEDREIYFNKFQILPSMIFNFAALKEVSSDNAFFARLNNQGLLQDIERKQNKISREGKDYKKLIDEIKNITRRLSLLNEGSSEWEEKFRKKKELEKILFQKLPEIKPEIYSVKEVAETMPNNSLLVEFQSYYNLSGKEKFKNPKNKLKKGYLALILKPNGDTKTIDLGDGFEIDEKIDDALSNINEFPDRSELIWEKISKLIFEPLEDDIKEIETLFISPDSKLNLIPFYALKVPNSKEYFSDSYNLRLLTTGRELIDLNKNNNLINQRSIIIANPSFDLKKSNLNIEKNNKRNSNSIFSRFKWNSLEGTKKEGESINKIIDSELYTEEKANESLVYSKKNPKIIHFASHSFYFDKEAIKGHSMQRSGIVLAGANNFYKNNNEDGYLTALEVSKMQWQGTELVVISGCDSGRGEILNYSNENIYGLKRAISVAGAKSSLLSLWKVDDKGTAKFMEYFYKQLKKGISKSDSLRETQRYFRNHPDKRLRKPLIWAAFQLSGDWRPIKF